MDKPAFDPSKPYTTASGKPEFDSSKPADTEPGVGESIGRGLAQGATLGFADELAGGGEALLDKLRGAHEALGELYTKHRNESRANFEKAKEAHPIFYGAGQLAGGLAPALATGGASIPEQLVAGAALGGANAIGNLNELDQKGALGQVATGVVGGAAGAGLGNVLARGAGVLAKPAGEAIEKAAPTVEEAVKKLGEAGVIGSLAHGNVPAAVGAVGARLAAPLAGKATSGLGQALGAVGRAAAKNPALLGRYGQILATAADAGPAALAATHFAMAQRDPEYQKAVLAAQNHPELQHDDGE
jgi:hypothetical protein